MDKIIISIDQSLSCTALSIFAFDSKENKFELGAVGTVGVKKNKEVYNYLYKMSALDHDTKKFTTCEQDTKQKDYEVSTDLFSRINLVKYDIIDILEDCIEVAGTDNVYFAYENLSFGSTGNASRDLACLAGALISSVLSYIKPSQVFSYAPTSIKKSFTGNGKAKKDDMINAADSDFVENLKELGFLKSKGLPDIIDSYAIGLHSLKTEFNIEV